MAIDHFENVFPTAIWDEEFSWLAARRRTPHENFDFQVFRRRGAGPSAAAPAPVERNTLMYSKGRAGEEDSP